MINSIIEAISTKLYTEFECKIHMEEIKQGLVEPCFFLKCLNPKVDHYFWNRYKRNNQFVIQYFPEHKNAYDRECNDIAEWMLWNLEYITIADETTPIRASGMNYEIVDGVLNFFINYDFFVDRVVDVDNEMETMTDEEGAKE